MFKSLLAVALVAPAVSFAGTDEFPSYYPPTTEAPRGCIEGKVEIFLEGNEQMVPVYYVCKNGSFKPVHGKALKPVKPRGCREGQMEIFLETGADGESTQHNRYVCRNGRFIRG